METEEWKRDFSGETGRTRHIPDVEYKGLQVVKEVSRLEGGLCHHQDVCRHTGVCLGAEVRR